MRWESGALAPRLPLPNFEFHVSSFAPYMVSNRNASAFQNRRNAMKTQQVTISNRNNNLRVAVSSNRGFPPHTPFMYSADPMLDLGYVRDHLDAIEKMARDRGATLDLAPFREIDTERRQLIFSTEKLKAERNKASEEIPRMKKAAEDATALLAHMKEVSDTIKNNDVRITELDDRLENFLLMVPNMPHGSVPVGKSSADNVEVRRWGTPPQFG